MSERVRPHCRGTDAGLRDSMPERCHGTLRDVGQVNGIDKT